MIALRVESTRAMGPIVNSLLSTTPGFFIAIGQMLLGQNHGCVGTQVRVIRCGFFGIITTNCHEEENIKHRIKSK